MATTATSFPASLSSEALLPVLTAQLGSELLAKQVIKTLEEAAEKEARKKIQQQVTSASSPSSDQSIIVSTSITSPNQNNNHHNNNNYHQHHHHHNTILKTTNQKSAFMPITSSITTSSNTIIRPIPKPLSPILSTPSTPTGSLTFRGAIPSSPLSASNILNEKRKENS
uniref:Uncharacterized protein n=1 Tax=Panagrolaimus sp. ES5 TaxID=591445 RepID=A0AC34FHM2_9BILA